MDANYTVLSVIQFQRNWLFKHLYPVLPTLQTNTISLHHHRAFSPQHNQHTTHTQHALRCSLTELQKISKVRHKFHQRAMLTTTDVTEKKSLQHIRKCFKKLADCSGTHEEINVFGRLTNPWKPAVNRHFSGPSWAGAAIRWTRRLLRALGQRGAKMQLCDLGSEERTKREWAWWKWMKHTIMQFMRR